MSFQTAVVLQAKQDQGGEAVGLTFTMKGDDPSVKTGALTLAVSADAAGQFEAGAVYYLSLEPRDTAGDEAPAGEKLAD
jgi:hypothetical protein